MEILCSLEQGKISVNKAVSLLRKYREAEIRKASGRIPSVQKGRWFKILVNDGEGHNIKLYVPVSLITAGFSVGKIALRSRFLKEKAGIQKAQNVLSSIDRRDLKQLVRAIKEAGRIDLVHVEDSKETVQISIV